MTFVAVAQAAAGLATGRLGWRPSDFWAATPAELRTAIAGLAGPEAPGPLGARDVRALMERFPDG